MAKIARLSVSGPVHQKRKNIRSSFCKQKEKRSYNRWDLSESNTCTLNIYIHTHPIFYAYWNRERERDTRISVYAYICLYSCLYIPSSVWLHPTCCWSFRRIPFLPQLFVERPGCHCFHWWVYGWWRFRSSRYSSSCGVDRVDYVHFSRLEFSIRVASRNLKNNAKQRWQSKSLDALSQFQNWCLDASMSTWWKKNKPYVYTYIYIYICIDIFFHIPI